jgi:hypothetical protein
MMRTLVLSVFLTFALSATAAPVPKTLRAKQEFLPLAVGNRWEFSSPDAPGQVNEVREVLEVEQRDGATYFTQKLAGSTQVYRVDAAGVAVVRTGNSDYKNPRVILTPTMKEGESWEWDAGGYTEIRTVGKAEKITVPAGEFEAVPIQYRYVQNGQDFQKGTVWYSAGTGLVRIDYDGQVSQMLKAFTPAKEKR